MVMNFDPDLRRAEFIEVFSEFLSHDRVDSYQTEYARLPYTALTVRVPTQDTWDDLLQSALQIFLLCQTNDLRQNITE